MASNTPCDCPHVLLLSHRMDNQESPPSLLDLPDPCLLAVLQCCAAANQRSLFSAARAHSRLHQAALLVSRSITLTAQQPRRQLEYHTFQEEQQHHAAEQQRRQHEQQRLDNVLLYLHQQGQRIDRISLSALSNTVTIQQLPPTRSSAVCSSQDLLCSCSQGKGLCSGVKG